MSPFFIGGAHSVLEPQGASILAKLQSGGAVMTEHVCGKGRAYLMGGTLGFTYLQDVAKRKAQKVNSQLYRDSYNPTEFSEAIRGVINLPAVKADVRRPIEIDAPGVHAGLREGPKGAVIVLVNYPRQKWENMKIRINGISSGRITGVFSTSLGKELDFQPLDESSVQIHLPNLSLTDMIGINFKQP